MKIGSFVLSKHAVVVSFILCFLFTCLITSAQDVPKVIPPSPEASALFRFQDYPMDYSTGLPSITIPLYEVHSGSLSVPVTLGYHASGRRVSDQDGPIALGWSLDAGGIISRTIYGSPDFGTPTLGTYYFPFPFRTTGLSNSTDYLYFEKIMHYNNDPSANILPWTESEYDVFSYNFGGNGGKFIFTDSNKIKTPVLLPYKPYVITPIYATSGSPDYMPRGLTEIDITDDKGVFYKFAQQETAGPDADYPVTSLSISQMISADKVDTINFKYTGFAQWNASFSDVRTYEDNWAITVGASGPPVNGNLTTTDNASNGTYQIKRLTEIDFREGKVLFNLVSGSDKMDNIQVFDINSRLIKTIKINRSLLDVLKQGGSSQSPVYSQVNNKLDSLSFKDNTGAIIENYGFEYYPTKYAGSETTLDQHYTDWWGFYNASGDINMIPDYYLPDGTHVGGTDFNREPDLNALQSGVLKKIIYPTGGNTVFNYENNMYSSVPNVVKKGPGLRVLQTTSTDILGSATTKTYKYGLAEAGYGLLELRPDITTMAMHQDYYFSNASGWSPGEAGTYGQYTFYSGFIPALSAMAGRPVIYTEVAEYNGTPDHNIGKTVYDYDNYAWAPSAMPVTGIQLIPKMHMYNLNYWNNPSLLSRTDYKNTASPSAVPAYSVRKSTSNVYNSTAISDVAALHVQRLQVYPQTGLSGSYYTEQFFVHFNSANIYAFSDYHIPVGIKTLTSSSETVYNDDGSAVNTTTSFTYNTRYYLSQKVENTSDAGTIKHNITYPFDYTGNAVLTQMISPAVNMLNFPVEQKDFRNTVPVKGVRTNYFNWGSANPMIKPQTVDVSKGTNGYETRVQFNQYDIKGNIVEQQKANDVKEVYLWGYNSMYPVAKILNTTYAIASAKITQSVLDNPVDDASLNTQFNNLRTIPGALVTTYTYAPLIGQTSVTDPGGKTTFYEYDGFNRLKNIKDYQGNIIKNYQYNLANSCGANCVVLPMLTFTSYNTPSYPVGVFNGSKQYIGIAHNPGEYVTLWNGNSVNQAIGVLSTNADSLHFNLNVATSATVPSGVFGLRYYQWDVFNATTIGMATDSLSFIDWGDGNKQLITQPRQQMRDTIPYGYMSAYLRKDFMYYWIPVSHTYSSSTSGTITVFHNETTEMVSITYDGSSTTQSANIRGYYPEKVKGLGIAAVGISTDLGIGNIRKLFELLHIHYAIINTDTSYHNRWQSLNQSHKVKWIKMYNQNGKDIISNLRVNFPNLLYLETQTYLPDINETWSAGGFQQLYILAMGIPGTGLTTSQTDLIVNQQAAANTVTNGFLGSLPTPVISSASIAAFNVLVGRGWTVLVTTP